MIQSQSKTSIVNLGGGKQATPASLLQQHMTPQIHLPSLIPTGQQQSQKKETLASIEY